jgi:exodeoxyribonuclease VII large subunit
MNSVEPVSVTTLTTHIVSLFQADDFLRDIYVLGEISNWKRAASGHIYFSLKDDGAAINSVMWRGNASAHGWLPQNGDQVIARGYVDVYPDRGVYQLYVNRIQPAGRGQLYAQFEALKAKLQVAGLFDADRKQPLPSLVRRIGVVTSADAAALRDILRVLSARWPLAEVVVFPTLVQGSDAPVQIAAALAEAVAYDRQVTPLDVVILARGGGSMEDLWSFNDERVALAVSECTLPIVCGVGHETDFTIADFVADARASTPSAAAAMCVPDQAEVRTQLAGAATMLAGALREGVEGRRQDVEAQMSRLRRTQPLRMLDLRRQGLDDRERRLHGVMANQLRHLRVQATSTRQQLAAMNPADVLRRGYSIVTDDEGTVVTGPEQVSVGERLEVRSSGGSYQVTVD